MNAIITKPVISIVREAASLSAITALQTAVAEGMQADRKESVAIQACAKILAAQVATLNLPLASKVATIKATYADEFAGLSSTKDIDDKQAAKRKSNAAAALNAARVCYVAQDMPVEVRPPADGKPAVFKPAQELSLSAMRAAAATVKETAKAAEAKAAAEAAIATMTPEMKAAAQAAAQAEAEKKAKEAETARLATVAAHNLEIVSDLAKYLPSILAQQDAREALDAALLNAGLVLSKSKKAPAERGSLSDQLKSLTK
jgi:hypothetical protein